MNEVASSLNISHPKMTIVREFYLFSSFHPLEFRKYGLKYIFSFCKYVVLTFYLRYHGIASSDCILSSGIYLTLLVDSPNKNCGSMRLIFLPFARTFYKATTSSFMSTLRQLLFWVGTSGFHVFPNDFLTLR